MATDANPKSGDNADTKEKVVFTPEQQARVDELIREKMGEAARTVRTELEATKTQLQTMEAELAEARKTASKAKTPEAKGEAKDEVDRLQAEIAEMRSARTSLSAEMENLRNQAKAKEREAQEARNLVLEVQKQNAIQNSAGKANFVDVGIVTKLTSDHIQYNEEKKKFEVINPDNGQPRYNSAYEPMTLDEFFTDFASKNPYLVRGGTKSGAGSTESQKVTISGAQYPLEDLFGPKSKPGLANKVALNDAKEYQRLKAQAKEKGLINY